jgi:hypothetical protein
MDPRFRGDDKRELDSRWSLSRTLMRDGNDEKRAGYPLQWG